ncbi:WecB/TagA/CpsF family glycosyltransferase [Marinobacter sp. chi1]|uniref:WecB/TagA/CpsF family glycosyltransferase n=1 Tax=Marinobacter suaedae TaxID=3057675 RepID=A0ABT8VWE8_9GAMM|nr:WecB/TagA/CpsF family glycosyltransferase [Marinobacter sp. chi1]MDO3720313.1 WecB/TagA/CpsF family glycosyltransferase [Marinobacter sp. chi1]
MKEDILGYRVDALSPGECCDQICNSIEAGEKRWLACMNPHSYAVSLQDQTFSSALHNSDYLVADGVGVVYASQMLGGNISERVTGSDVFSGVLERLNRTGGRRVFFLGSTEETLAAIRKRLARDYPNVILAGTYSPPFKPEYSRQELDEMIAAVNLAQADVLWVGMTAPKQEKWIMDNFQELDVRFAAAIGAVFDFYTGRVKRSHPAFQRVGLEWLPRLVQEPKRLWRRMFVSAPVFLIDVLKSKWFGKRVVN